MSDLSFPNPSCPLTRERTHACAGDEGEGVQETSKSSTATTGLQHLSFSQATSPLYASAHTHMQVMRGRGSKKEAKAARTVAKANAKAPAAAGSLQPLRLRLVGTDRAVPVVGVHACSPWLPEALPRLPGESLEQFTTRVLHLVRGTGDVVLHLMHEAPPPPAQKVLLASCP
jgi:hypothetical protein